MKLVLNLREHLKRKKWVKSLPKVGQKTVFSLFKKLLFINDNEVSLESQKLYNKVKDGINLDSTVIANITKSTYGFSDYFVFKFWMINDLYNQIHKRINESKFNESQTIILIDDFLGSGDSVERALSSILRKHIDLTQKRVISLSIIATDHGVKYIEEYCESKQISIEIFYNFIQKKAFEPGYIFSNSKGLVAYNNLCNILKINEDRLGYMNCESLVSFEYNTPNNTLPIFHEDKYEFKPYYTRLKKRVQVSELKKRRTSSRKIPHYFDKTNDEFKYILFLSYIDQFNVNFNIQKTCEALGLTLYQLNNFIDKGFSNNHIVLSNNKFCINDIGISYISEATYKFLKMYNIQNYDRMEVKK